MHFSRNANPAIAANEVRAPNARLADRIASHSD
jgi:hypothetical protein